MDDKRKLATDISMVVGTNYLVRLAGIPVSLIVAKIFTPFEYGILGMTDLVSSYSAYVPRAIQFGLSRELPFYKERGDLVTAEKLQNTALLAILSLSLLVAAGMVGYATFVPLSSLELAVGLLATASVFFASHLEGFYKVLLQADLRFWVGSQARILRALGSLVLLIPLVLLFRIYGYFGVSVFLAFFALVYFAAVGKYRFHLQFDWATMKLILGTGMPLLLLDFLWMLFKSLDRTLIARMMSIEELGLYSFASRVSSILYIGASNVGSVMLPLFARRFEKDPTLANIRGTLLKPLYATAYGIVLLLGCCILVGPWLVEVVYPQYRPVIPAMQYLLLGTYFWALLPTVLIFLNATNQKRRSAIGLVALLPLYTGAIVLAVWSGYGLPGVALAALVAYFLLATYMLGSAVFPLVSGGDRERLKVLLSLSLPFACLWGGYFLLYRQRLLGRLVGAEDTWWVTVANLGIFNLFFLGVTVLYNRLTGILDEALSIGVSLLREGIRWRKAEKER